MVFRVDAGNNYVVLHGFNLDDGYKPQGRLVLGQDGYLYGVTARGGEHDSGVIYRLDTDGNNFSVLHDFEAGSSFGWFRQLIQDSAGTLYGTNYSSPNIVFRIEANGSNYSVIHTFDDASEGRPTSVMLASDGLLYGTSAGTLDSVFRLATNGADFETIHTFTDEDEGQEPGAALIEGTDGVLYGTATTGGQFSGGTAFKLSKEGSSFEVIHQFQTSDGTLPAFALTQVAGGLLYGIGWSGGAGGGTIFRMTTSGELFHVVHDFESSTGDDPRAASPKGSTELSMAPRITGGRNSHGVVYRQSIPRIASVSPSSGPAGGGTLVTISGSGFQSGAAVTMGGSLAGAVIGPSAITASSPPLSAGSLNDVLVTNPERRWRCTKRPGSPISWTSRRTIRSTTSSRGSSAAGSRSAAAAATTVATTR